MDELVLTVLMLGLTIILFLLRYVVPIIIAIVGGILVRKGNRKLGYVVICVGIVVEIVSLLIKIFLQ